jgi:S1-C subfamily serine protease
MTDRAEFKLASAAKPADQAFDADALFRQYQASSVNVFKKVAIGPNVIPQTVGSGFIIDVNVKKDFCRIGTDNHVGQDGNPIMVRLSDNKEYPAIVEKADAANDLAILRVSGVAKIASVCKPIPLVDGTLPAAVGDKVLKLTSRNGSPEYSVGTVGDYFIRSQAPQLTPWPGEDVSRRMIFVKGKAETGDSGGAILTRLGAIGVQDANGPGGMGVTPANYLKRDLEELKKYD